MAAEYLRRHDFTIMDMNVRAKFGELDIIASSEEGEKCLHIVEVKTLRCREFPTKRVHDIYDPSQNLHDHKIQKVARMGAWYVSHTGWEGEWQVDGVLVWLRERDGLARVSYYPQIL